MLWLTDLVRVVHVVNAVLMAWPFYALVAVNQRVRLGPPLGDRVDRYMENLIKNRTVPCFVFQATALVTGLALIFLQGFGVTALLEHPTLGTKLLLLLGIMGLLMYVHLRLQPRIDALFADAGMPVDAERAARIGALRRQRKRLASVCLFAVLVMVMLGLQAWIAFPIGMTGLLVLALGLFTWRAYNSVTPWGWF